MEMTEIERRVRMMDDDGECRWECTCGIEDEFCAPMETPGNRGRCQNCGCPLMLANPIDGQPGDLLANPCSIL